MKIICNKIIHHGCYPSHESKLIAPAIGQVKSMDKAVKYFGKEQRSHFLCNLLHWKIYGW